MNRLLTSIHPQNADRTMSFFTEYNNCCPAGGRTSCPIGWVDVLAVVNTPPSTPSLVRYYLVGTSPTGVFAGQAGQYAYYRNGWKFCPPHVGDKVTVDGSCGWSCWNGTTWIPYDPTTQANYTGINLGNGTHGNVFKQVTAGQFQFREIIGTGAATVTTVDDQVIVNVTVPPSGSGEMNSGINVGASGAGIYKSKTGLILQFRKVYCDDGSILISEEADQVRFRANIPPPNVYTVQNIGSNGLGLYDSVASNTFRIKKLAVNTPHPTVFSINDVGIGENLRLDFLPANGTLGMFGDTAHLYDAPALDGQVMRWNNVQNSWVPGTMVISSLGSGEGTVYGGNPSPLNWRIKSIRQGANVTITQDANEITISAAAGGVYTASNLGTGADGEVIYSTTVGNDFRFKRLKAGTDIFLTAEANDVLVRARSQVAGSGITITAGATDNTIEVAGWATLLTSGSSGTAHVLGGSAGAWLIRRITGGTGIVVTENAQDISLALSVAYSSLGGGVAISPGWSGSTFQTYSLSAGAGIDVQLSGNVITISNTGGGGGGGGVSGTSLVGTWYNDSVFTGLDRWGLTATTVKFPGTSLSTTGVTKNGANEEFTFNKTGKWRISAKVTLDTGASQTQHQVWCEVDTGGGWTEVAGTRTYAFTNNEVHDLQTLSTGEFSLQVANLATKVRFRVITNGGPVRPYLLNGGTSLLIEEVVGPAWGVVTEAGTTRTLSANDNGTVIVCTNGAAVTITLPQTLLAGFQCDIIQQGAGVVNMQTSGAAFIQTTAGGSPRTISAQHGRVRIIAVSGTGADSVYNISGNIA